MKTFKAPSQTEAYAMIKADLGEDAVILSNKTVSDNGTKCCEIVAAIDEMPQRQVSTAPTRESVLDEALNDSVGWKHEWGQIKGHLMALLKPQMNLQSLSPRQQLAMEYLEREGVDSNVLLNVFCKLRDNANLSILRVLEGMASIRPLSADSWSRKMHAFAGPHGAGKSSALIRVALREKAQNPGMKICLVAADGNKGKGRLVLKHYAELSGLAFRELITHEDVAALKREAGAFDLILIDLPGMSVNNRLEDWLLAHGMEDWNELAVHLVLNPYYNSEQYRVFAERYKSSKVASVIWTKLDEACTFGAILNMACSSGLPISALSYGSGLKNSITPATKEMIWRMLFMRQLPGSEN
ncbi:flagellar biosynthesis protein FlhF [Salidesulfovibrio onnuriiensis]|uniref:flagellar biosynthesis protein FlhF n=1 Tax=Salidesulfovibrio onnuriiensis TaxID=2583823 RepID=UPI0032B71CC1